MAVKINKRVTLLDSMNFMSGSLDSLFSSINSSCSLNIIKRPSLLCDANEENRTILKDNADERLALLTRKGIFPYQWTKTFKDYSLPNLVAKEGFYNTRTDSCITDEQYLIAKKDVGNI